MWSSLLLVNVLGILCLASEQHNIESINRERYESLKHPKMLVNDARSGDANYHLAELKAPICKHSFEGFGVHLGSIGHLSSATPPLIDEVADKLYNDLNLRRFRTSYEPFFSLAEDEYDISCQNNTFTCTWQLIHRAMAKYPDATYMASIWSPPYYMKNELKGLKIEYEEKYYYFIKNITQLIKTEFNQTIELVSLVNEPENFIVVWDHCLMLPDQICRMVEDFNDPLVSGCTENAWFSITNVYMDFSTSKINCRRACKTVLTHAYAVNFDVNSPNYLSASYDTNEYNSRFEQPIWQTEVSSTYGKAHENQMEEAVELSRSIIHFVGTTCVTRYYYWLAFTSGTSGESLIWGDTTKQELNFPKKYFAYRHFTTAANEHKNANVQRCDGEFYLRCLKFSNPITDEATAIFIIERNETVLVQNFKNCDVLCCTSEGNDHECEYEDNALIPSPSVCSCKLKTPIMNSYAKSIYKPGASILLIINILFLLF